MKGNKGFKYNLVAITHFFLHSKSDESRIMTESENFDLTVSGSKSSQGQILANFIPFLLFLLSFSRQENNFCFNFF